MDEKEKINFTVEKRRQVLKDIENAQPGAYIKVSKQDLDYLKKHPPCKHPYLVPLEIGFGKKSYLEEKGMANKPREIMIDWCATAMGAHFARVMTYYCPNCGKEIKAPTRKER